VSVPSDSPQPEEVSSDLVEYFVVLVESRESLVKVVPALAELVESQSIGILDVVVVASDAAGHVEAIEVDAIDNLVALHGLDGTFGGLLSRHDIELVSLALPPSSAAIVLVAEDRWAQPLSVAARSAGGKVLAGERIGRERVEAALAVLREAEKGEPPCNDQ